MGVFFNNKINFVCVYVFYLRPSLPCETTCYGSNIIFLQQTCPSLSLFHHLHASTCHVSWLATLLLPLFSLVQSYQTHLYEHLLHHIHYVQINIHKNKLINYLLSAILCFIGLFIFIKSIYEYF